MNKSFMVVLALMAALTSGANAAVSANDLPGNTVWYMHADLQAMRDTESGRQIYAWFEDEVIEEVSEELGIDLNKEINVVTAFSDSRNGAAMIIEGPISKATEEKMLEMAMDKTEVDTRQHKGMSYYFMGDDESAESQGDEPFEDFEEASYSSFAIKGKIIIAGREEQLKELLDNKGRIVGGGEFDDALFVISADKSFVQAGVRTDGLSDDDDDGWESNILRNTEQAALLVSEVSGMIAVEAQLVSTDPKMAQGIAGIINGLIALQSFSTDIPADVKALIANTKVEVEGNVLSINAVIDPDLVVSILNH
ncbi:MAG: hypothetical protein HOI35_08325 [Woeseia sp.]|jgi:hypothetical protein|nr:hypothetical protein [Woeseia sp.]MBT6210008.1 hypothetical protein [Woeseia sp.]